MKLNRSLIMVLICFMSLLLFPLSIYGQVTVECSDAVNQAIGDPLAAQDIAEKYNAGLKKMAEDPSVPEEFRKGARDLYNSKQTIRFICVNSEKAHELGIVPPDPLNKAVGTGQGMGKGDFNADGTPRKNGISYVAVDCDNLNNYGYKRKFYTLAGDQLMWNVFTHELFHLTNRDRNHKREGEDNTMYPKWVNHFNLLIRPLLKRMDTVIENEEPEKKVTMAHPADTPLKQNSGFCIEPVFGWQHDAVGFNELGVSVQTHIKQGLEFPEYDVYAADFGMFSRAKIGLNLGYALNEELKAELCAEYFFGCDQEFEQGWNYPANPQYFNHDNLIFDFTTVSFGAGIEIGFGQADPWLKRLDLEGKLNYDIHNLSVGYNHEMQTAYEYELDKGTLSGSTSGMSFSLGGTYNLGKGFSLGLDFGYKFGKFGKIKGDLTDENDMIYEGELQMTPLETGDYITIQPSDQPYGENCYPVKFDLSGMSYSINISYRLPLGGISF